LIGIACPFNEGCCAMPSRAVDEAWHGLILQKSQQLNVALT